MIFNHKLRPALLISLLFLFTNTFGQILDTLHWRPDYKLTWADFQGTPSGSVNDAITYCSLYYYSYYDSDTSIAFVVDNIFYKKTSWVKQTGLNNFTLGHEQTHYNISEFFARKLRDEFKKYKPVPGDSNSANWLLKKTDAGLDAVQRLYDRQTSDPRRDTAMQNEWNMEIDELLEYTRE
jgi:hypothetical protein